MHLIQLYMLLQLVWLYNDVKVFATQKALEPGKRTAPLKQQQPKKKTTHVKTTKAPVYKGGPPELSAYALASKSSTFSNSKLKGKKVDGPKHREFTHDCTNLEDLLDKEQRSPASKSKDLKTYEAENKSIHEKCGLSFSTLWNSLPLFKVPKLEPISKDKNGASFAYYPSQNQAPHIIKLYYEYSSAPFLKAVYMYTSIQAALQTRGDEMEGKYNAVYENQIGLQKASSSYFLRVIGKIPKSILTNEHGGPSWSLLGTTAKVYTDGLVYEACNGGTLYSYVKSVEDKIRRMSSWSIQGLALVKAVLYQILEALMILHEMGFTHFNLIPDNIYVQRLKEFDEKAFAACGTFVKQFDYFMSLFTIKLTGFEDGLHYNSQVARFRSIHQNSGFSITNAIYRSPESFMGSTNLGPTTDLWSVGLIFLELVDIKSMFKPAEAVLRSVTGIELGRRVFYCMIPGLYGDPTYIGNHLLPKPRLSSGVLPFPSYEEFGGSNVIPHRKYHDYFKHRYEAFWDYIKKEVFNVSRDNRTGSIHTINWRAYYGIEKLKDFIRFWNYRRIATAALHLLGGLVDLNPNTRSSAETALRHEFFEDVTGYL